MKIRVMVVDDQPIVAEGIRSILAASEKLDVVAVAGDGTEALRVLAEIPADVVLLDIRMPEMNGIVTTGEIRKKYPDTKVLILTTFDDSDYILSALNQGASGYLLKDVSSAALIEAVVNAYGGDTILPSRVAKKITEAAQLVSAGRELRLRNSFGLSERETEIAVMLLDGFNNRQIASALGLSGGTARNYISAIYVKLGCDNRLDAVNVMKNELK